MAKTYSDLFSEIRSNVKLISLEALKERVESRAQKPFTLVDVREKDEVRAGYIPGAVHVPRGFLEMQAEQKLPNKSEEIIVYCAGGTRLTRPGLGQRLAAKIATSEYATLFRLASRPVFLDS